jgi:hypothetical protein
MNATREMGAKVKCVLTWDKPCLKSLNLTGAEGSSGPCQAYGADAVASCESGTVAGAGGCNSGTHAYAPDCPPGSTGTHIG